MKRTLKMLSAAFAVVMLLSAVAAPVAMAATTNDLSNIIINPDLYIMEQLWKGRIDTVRNVGYKIN